MKNESSVELVHVSLHHGTRQILRDISLRLSEGVTLLYGANGAGKSSLLKLLAGLQSKAKIAGQGQVLGAALTPRHAAERAKIGYMPQQGGMYEELSSFENLQFRAAMLGLPEADARCLEITSTYGLTSILKQRVEQLSGGWRQRLAFALTMLAQPRLLLLDEPTAGVDLDAKARIWQQIEIEKRRGTRIMISSHDPHEALQADHLLHLHRGSIEYSGAPTALGKHFGLRVAHLPRPADLSALQRLHQAIERTLAPLFIDLTHHELRIVISNIDEKKQPPPNLSADDKEYSLSWSEAQLEDGLRAALLMSAQHKLNSIDTLGAL